MKNDIFISYRRESGATAARLLYQLLKSDGYTCFFDAESIEAGNFSENIRHNLEESPNFILIVSSRSLERCHNPDDWVRKEIETAIELDKNIIPIFVNGITGFPPNLPSTIDAIRLANGITLNHNNFDENFSKLKKWIRSERSAILINKFLSLHNPDDPEEVTWVLEALQVLIPSSNILDIAKEQIYRYWNGDIEKLLSPYPEYYLRQLCQKLDLSQIGGKDILHRRIDNWLSGLDTTLHPDEQVSSAILNSTIENLDSYDLKYSCDDLDIKIDRRSPQKMRLSLLAHKEKLDVEKIIKSLSLPQLEEITSNSLGQDKAMGTKRELAEILCMHYKNGLSK